MAAVTLVLFLITTLVFSRVHSDGPGWIRLCTVNSTRIVHAGGCPRGIFVPSPLSVTFACVNGVWILSNGDCDRNPIILVGRGLAHCFSLSIQVDKVAFVGVPGDPFGPGDYVGPSSLSILWPLDLGTTSSGATELTQGHALLSVNSDNVIEVANSGGISYCCQTPSLVRLCMGRGQSGPQYFRVLSAASKISFEDSNMLASFALNPGEGLRLGNRNFKDSLRIYAEGADGQESCGLTQPTFETDCCSSLHFEDEQTQVSTEQKRINEQTARIATTYLELAISKQEDQEVETKEYAFVEFGKRIISHVCPEEDLPAQFLDSMLHLFHLLLAETMMDSPVDSERHNQIMDSLKSCLETAKESPRIKLNWETKGTCSHKVLSVCVSNEHKETILAPNEMSLNQTFLYEVLDFPLEVIWKVMLFTHYYCAREFRFHATDHSQLMVSFESFYNLDLRRRWGNPGKSYEVMKILFPTMSLPRLAAALDACVVGAKVISDYTEWIHRPILPQLGSSSVLSPPAWIWNQSTLCLYSYWEAQRGETPCYPAHTQFYKT